jgi:hypothetical protein
MDAVTQGKIREGISSHHVASEMKSFANVLTFANCCKEFVYATNATQSSPTKMKVLNVLLFVIFASSASARVGPPHRLLKAENGRGIPDEYVVLLGKKADPRGILQGLRNGGQATQVLHVYENAVKGFTVRTNLNALFNALKNIDDVTIEENQVVNVSSVQTPVDSWGLDRVDQVAGTNNQYSYDRDGSNVDVYIVDTGIDRNHQDFGGRASFGIDVSGSGEGDVDNNGHGTHVAGKFAWLLFLFIVHYIMLSYLHLRVSCTFQVLLVGRSTGLPRIPT